MQITQVRNATLIVGYAGKRFLIDPMLAPKGAYPSFPGTPNDTLSNPLVDLPMPVSDIVDVDAVVVTHTHRDHWDADAQQALPKDKPVFAQDAKDADAIRSVGFTDVRVLSGAPEFEGVTLVRTPGQHGSDEAVAKIGDRLGSVCGVVFRHPEEKTLYVAGDTVWNRFVADNLATHEPDVVVVNCGDARIIGVGPIIMGKEDVLRVRNTACRAIVVASHMEAVNHAILTRSDLRDFLKAHSVADRVIIPADGETLRF